MTNNKHRKEFSPIFFVDFQNGIMTEPVLALSKLLGARHRAPSFALGA